VLYTWFKIFNRIDFNALGLVSKTYTLNLQGIGQKDVLVTKGITYGITYDGVFISVGLNDLNPFSIDDRAIYVDNNNDVYLGIAVET